MTLPPGSDPVKPERSVLAVAALTVALTALAMVIIVAATSRDQQRLDRFGSVATEALAKLTVEPMIQQDRMHLGVIANRLAELDEIAGVASYTAENQLLTTTGDLQGPQYTHPVTIDDSIVGYVRVALEPDAFTISQRGRVGAMLIALLLIPLAVTGAWKLARSARNGELHGLLPALQTPPEPGDAAIEAPPEPPPAADIRHYLLAVNLYNQLTLQPNEREFELALCLEFAEAVAEVYQGQVVALPGVGALVDFDHTEDDDRPFHVLCAAFVLARLLHDEAPFGTYRLGLTVTELPADETVSLDNAAIADAALLSALARDLSLAVSAPFAHVLDAGQRVTTRPLINPLLDELSTGNVDCRLITALEAPYAGLVAQQAEQLRGQRDAIASPSTF